LAPKKASLLYLVLLVSFPWLLRTVIDLSAFGFLCTINKLARSLPCEIAVYINSDLALVVDCIRFGKFFCCKKFGDAILWCVFDVERKRRERISHTRATTASDRLARTRGNMTRGMRMIYVIFFER
jgi:hypothetical protein